ncbi:MAG: hypothetical protein WKF40_02905 [Thermoleophilaceae bacterium]
MTRTDPEIERLRRRLERERRACKEAEQIAESTTSALYDRQRELQLLEAVAVAANEAATPGGFAPRSRWSGSAPTCDGPWDTRCC